ncbi:aspartate 1-decarboxylase [Selenihalanaerobacter shriftii]|uniref:Aspartate 1-decarboxylase n=1 Tax=Selenihalanaerobacter shriftii TaxID=142842 RepID=A0A1T4QUC2_9FIRM|nr:aspartate 1-decarboxylase [Selenihalanaerobacter shriftii]SKA07373.1 L-aspartate 1-decarboxylase [Selenihalanaerobacter shriftii]
MIRIMHKSKIHRATVTDANLDYVGSITIDQKLLEEADILPNEKVQVVNNNNGTRFETYVISGERGSGDICLNGAAARKAQPGDTVIIISYGLINETEAKELEPKVILVDEDNNILHQEE